MKLTRFTAPALAIAMLTTTGIVFAQQPYGPPPPPREGYEHGGWDAPPQEFREIARRGFHDGIEGAHRDMENHRRPNVNNRDEFRHPNVPREARHEYRDGFRRGYDAAFNHGPDRGYGPPPPRPY